jgi:uncharacterized protein
MRPRITAAFFRNFFAILVLTVSVSQWGMLWWLLHGFVGPLPTAVHVGAIALLFLGNRTLSVRRQHRRRDNNPAGSFPRLYYAVSFSCLFCFLFLATTGVVWIVAKVFVGAIAVEASTRSGGGSVATGVDMAFRWLGNVGVGAIALTFVYGYTIGQLRLRVTRLRLRFHHAAAALDGFRIAQISDLHIGQNLELEQLQRFVARVNELQPDLVCITGDIADGPASDLAAFLPSLAQLRATHGVVAIMGNHDHYARADWVEAELRARTPFVVLRDAHTSLTVGAARLHIVGLDDRGRDWARGVPAVRFLDEALAGLPDDEPVLLLCHRPDVFSQAARAGVALTLSGHTHGGQIGLPWFGGRIRNFAEFITPYDRGLYERDGSYLYVNCGLGVTGQRVRLCTPREITLIEVCSDPAAAPTRDQRTPAAIAS